MFMNGLSAFACRKSWQKPGLGWPAMLARLSGVAKAMKCLA